MVSLRVPSLRASPKQDAHRIHLASAVPSHPVGSGADPLGLSRVNNPAPCQSNPHPLPPPPQHHHSPLGAQLLQ
ncbi:unnamed protein product [Arctogadus glacialis]